tara:strand:+ start:43 stop:1077 length:1035 start_codon:yes stop_codon:yes gene_type:complete
MDLYSADTTSRSARHLRRQEVERYNQEVEYENQQRVSEIDDLDIGYSTLAESRKTDDIVNKAASFATASGSLKALGIDLASGQITGGRGATDAKKLQGASKGLFGSSELIEGRRAARLAKATARELPGNVVKLGEAPLRRGIGFGALVSKNENAIAHSVSRIAEHEGATLAAKSGNSVIKAGGEAALKGGEKVGASAIGKSLVKQLGPAANIGFAADVAYDLAEGNKSLGDESALEETSDISQLVSGVAEVGSLGVGAAIGLGLLGIGAAPIVAGLAVIGAVAGATSAVAGGFDSYDKIKNADADAKDTLQIKKAEYNVTNPQKTLKSLELSNIVEGTVAPKLQ